MRKTRTRLVSLLVLLCGLASLYLVMSIRAGARVFEAPAGSNDPDAAAPPPKDEQHFYGYDVAISTKQMRESVKLIGGDLQTLLFDQDHLQRLPRGQVQRLLETTPESTQAGAAGP